MLFRSGRNTLSDIWSTSSIGEKKTKCRLEYWSTSEVGGEKNGRGAAPDPLRLHTATSSPRTHVAAAAREEEGRESGCSGGESAPPAARGLAPNAAFTGKSPSAPPTGRPRWTRRGWGPPPCVTAPRSPPPPPSPLLRPPAWPRPEGKGLRRQATAGRGRDGTRLPHPRRATEGERETNRPRETEEKTIPPQPPHGRSGDRAGAEATAPVTPGRATRSRASERACHGKARRDKPLCRGLTFNRSQRGSCSATYETPTQKQVVYEWFSARFHTNVRST